MSQTKSVTVKDSLSGAVKRLGYLLNTWALIYRGGSYRKLCSICMGHCIYGACVELTSRAICAARLRRPEAAFSHTSSMSTLLTGLLARRPMTVNASTAAMKEHIPTNIHVKQSSYITGTFYTLWVIKKSVTFLDIFLLDGNFVNTELSEDAVRVASLCLLDCIFCLEQGVLYMEQ